MGTVPFTSPMLDHLCSHLTQRLKLQGWILQVCSCTTFFICCCLSRTPRSTWKTAHVIWTIILKGDKNSFQRMQVVAGNIHERWNLKMDFTSWKRIDHTELFIQLQTLIKSIAGGWGLKPTQIYNWTKFCTRNSSISSVAEQAAVSPSLIFEIHAVKILLSCLYKRGGEEDLHFSNLEFKDNRWLFALQDKTLL